jgi:hypothetical protein
MTGEFIKTPKFENHLFKANSACTLKRLFNGVTERPGAHFMNRYQSYIAVTCKNHAKNAWRYAPNGVVVLTVADAAES